MSINIATGLISGSVDSTFSQHGPYPVTVTVSNASATATSAVNFTWTVNNVAATVVEHVYAVAENTPVTVTAAFGVLTGSSDPGGETIRAVLDQAPLHGTLVLNSDGSFTYTPNTGYTGPDGFTFHGFDGLDGGNVVAAILNVGDTSPPVLANPGDQFNTEGDVVSLQIEAIDLSESGLVRGPRQRRAGLQRHRLASRPEHRRGHRRHQWYGALDIRRPRALRGHRLRQ